MSRIITRKIEIKKPEQIKKILDIKDFFYKRNQILIIRSVGGLGDILMHRMMFEDIKDLMPDAEIHFACPRQYHDALKDHPFIDKIIDSANINKTEYIISYNTTTACGRYEMSIAPQSNLNRSDIWASHCGIELKKHDMHISLTEEEKSWGKSKLEQLRDRVGPIVLVAPISAMANKNLLDSQLLPLIDQLYLRNCCPIGLHNTPIEPLFTRNKPCLYNLSIRQWMAVINQADYIISVDTSSFHCAGGMKKPTTGIFTFADGYVYGKYYPNVEIVQLHRINNPEWTCGPCYNWCNCIKTKNNLKPCLTEITTDMILNSVDKMFTKWPDERIKKQSLVTNIG